MTAAVLLDDAAARRTVRRTTRGWLVPWSLVALALAVLLPAAAALAVDRWGTLETSTWQYVGTPLGWTVFTVAVIVSTVSLPLYVAYGVSRHAVVQTCAALGAGIAVAGGLLMAAGYAGEAVLYTSLGAAQVVGERHLYDDPGQWHLVAAEHGLLVALMLLAGWIVGLLFYRLPWGWALAGLAVLGCVYGAAGWLLGRGPTAVTLAALVTAVAALGVAAYRLARDLPVRPKGG